MSDGFGLWEVFASMFWFMLLITWIWMIIAIFGDIFRDRELSGWGKALWSIFIIIIPWLGALVYLIVRGSSMGQRSASAAEENSKQFQAYVQSVATVPSTSEELHRLVEMRDSGRITAEEYEQAKAKVLA